MYIVDCRPLDGALDSTIGAGSLTAKPSSPNLYMFSICHVEIGRPRIGQHAGRSRVRSRTASWRWCIESRMRKILNRLKRGQGADSKELVSHDSGPTFRVSAADTLDRATSMCPWILRATSGRSRFGGRICSGQDAASCDCFERRNGRTGSQSVAWSSEFRKTRSR